MKIPLFIPCMVAEFFPEAGEATRRILEYLGHDVVIPDNQICCGQPAYNSGYTKESTDVAEYWLDQFAGADAIVAPSGSCISMVINHYLHLPLSKKAATIHRELREKGIWELSEFLVNVLNVEKIPSTFSGTVTYHQSCHLSNELGVKKEPQLLLRNIPKLNFIEMKDADRCCGFGGTFSVKFPELSTTMTQYKADRVIDSGAEVLTGADISCLMNIHGLLKKQAPHIRVLHLATILAEGL